MRNFNIFKSDFVGVKDNLLTKEECREAIRWTKTHKILQEDRQKEQSGYSYCDLMDRGESIGRCFSPKPLRPIERGLRLLVDSYVEKYPEVQMVESWDIDYVDLNGGNQEIIILYGIQNMEQGILPIEFCRFYYI